MELAPLELIERARDKAALMERTLGYPRLANLLFRYVLHPLAFDRNTELNKRFRYGFMIAGGGVLPVEDLPTMQLGFRAKRESLDQLLAAMRSGEPVVWLEWALTREVVRAFGVASLCPEAMLRAGYSVEQQVGLSLMEEAERLGMPNEGCSSQKGAVGAWALKQLPKPTAILATTHPCDSGVMYYQILEQLTGVPVYAMETPYRRDAGGLRFYASSLRDMITFLEDRLHKKFDWDRFKAIIEEFNHFTTLAYEISEMGRAVPCPYSVATLHQIWELRAQSSGSAVATQMAETLHATVKRRFQAGQGVVSREKIRVMWWDVPIAFSPVCSWMEKEFGAVIVTDYISRNLMAPIDTSSQDSMLEGLARAHFYHGMRRQCHGPAEYITEELQDIIDAYAPHCFIFSQHLGCKHGWAVARLVQDVCRKTGLPVLAMTTDIFDPRATSEEKIRDEIARFFRANGLAS